MNILITGAGLIGAHAARHAVDAGHKVVLYDLSPNRNYIHEIVGTDRVDVVAADIRDLPALLSALEQFKIDTVVHTAGLIGSRVQENSYTGATNNILGTINVLEAARLRQLRRVVYTSTFGVYDRSKIDDSVVRESHPSEAIISMRQPKYAPSTWFMPTPRCIGSIRQFFDPAAFSVEVSTSAVPPSAKSCAISRSTSSRASQSLSMPAPMGSTSMSMAKMSVWRFFSPARKRILSSGSTTLVQA